MRGRLTLVTTEGELPKGLVGSTGSAVIVPDVPEWVSPLLTVVPLQWLALELARLRVAQGYRRPLAKEFNG